MMLKITGNALPPSITGHPIEDRATPQTSERCKSAIGARASATVRLRPQWVWHRLSDPCNWPQFLEHLTDITKSDFDMDEYTWSVLGLTCKMRLTVREPPLHLAWQSGSDPQMQLSGEIILEPLDWYTHLTVQLNYVTADPHLTALLQTLELQLQRDVTRMAQVLERGLCEPS